MILLLFFIIWRIFDFLVIFFSQKYIPYLGFFPYANQLPGYHLPTLISSLANFDGLHYILIAKDGYAQYEQAFFPLYPLTIKFLTPLFSNNQLLTGLIISNVSFLIGLIMFVKLFKSRTLNSKFEFWLIIFLLTFPTSFFFGSVYTEGLFFLLFISTLYFLKKENYILMALFSFLASTTRLIGVFLIIPIVFHFFNRDKKLSQKSNIYYLISIIFPIVGLSAYCFYLFKTTGDPLFFLTSQPLFGANRSTHLIFLPQVYWRYIKIFITAAHDSRYLVSVIEFLIFNFVFIVLILDLFKNLKLNKNFKFQILNFDLLGLNLFSFANLILPTLTGTFSSIPRYALFSLSFFIYISQTKNIIIKYSIIVVFVFLHILLLGFFAQGYFVS